MDDINELNARGILFCDVHDAEQIAKDENMYFRTNAFRVVRVVLENTNDEYGYAVENKGVNSYE